MKPLRRSRPVAGCRIWRLATGYAAILVACLTTPACGGAPFSDADAGFEAFLPPPLDSGWQRSEPHTGPADQDHFGGGVSTSADYANTQKECALRITMTGNAPMMQAFSMNFSNPAAAGLTGAKLSYAGDIPVVITAAGEAQVLTKNYLTQYAGDCDLDTKLAYVQATPFDALGRFRLRDPRAQNTGANAPPEGVAWQVAVGGPAKDWAYALTATHDGGVCTAGRTASKGAGLEDAWIVCLDGQGKRLRDRTFGGPAIDRARAIVETPDRGLVMAGATQSKGAGEFDAWVVKIDREGRLAWDRHFGGPATDWASALTTTRDGGLAVGAYTQDVSGGPYDFWVIRLDGGGRLLWQRRYGGAATDWSNAIAETTDGDLVVVGHTESTGAGGPDFWVLKLNADGDPLWAQSFGGAETDYASTVTATRDGGVVVGGMTRSEGAGAFDIRVIRLDRSGKLTWDRTLGGAGNDWVRAVVETRDGTIALAGYTDSRGAGLNDVWFAKLGADGTLLDERTFGEAGNEWARAMVEMPDGSLVLAGDTYSRGAGAADVLVLKIEHD